MNAPLRYKGYEVAPSAQQLPNGLYAANLTIGALPDQRAGNERRGAQHSFDALDYFFDERHALAYACRWARMWIDEQRRCA
ncbi:transcriptional regulator [Paraburkholderia sp. J41]|uniref:transcriptional regulator n=1 Tax=Paraburkholderia sp. J41 TaxID=2805433 RepID=UPI002AC32A25|nr:transcriptional regulator [Paraburkholderia sp. J41]